MDTTRNTWNLIQNHWVIIQQAYYAMKLPSHPDILKKKNTSNLSLESSNHTSKTFKQLPTHSFTTSPKHPVRGKASQKDTSEYLSRTFPWKVPMIPMIHHRCPEAPCPWPGRRRGARSFLEGGGKACRSPLPSNMEMDLVKQKRWVFHGDYPLVN
jgi:hypothetical protein